MDQVRDSYTGLYQGLSNLTFDPIQQFILAFSFGVVLSPWHWGWVFLLASILIFEVAYFLMCSASGSCVDVLLRVGIFYCKIFGFIVGRTVSGGPMMRTGVQWRTNLALVKDKEDKEDEMVKQKEQNKKHCTRDTLAGPKQYVIE